MRVFISWSGAESNNVATAISEWLPNVLQATQPWFSPKNLAKGSQWASELFQALEKSKVGIFCLTPSNIHSPWIAFEAAACSTKVGGKVFTYLYKLQPAAVDGPLAIFNHSVANIVTLCD